MAASCSTAPARPGPSSQPHTFSAAWQAWGRAGGCHPPLVHWVLLQHRLHLGLPLGRGQHRRHLLLHQLLHRRVGQHRLHRLLHARVRHELHGRGRERTVLRDRDRGARGSSTMVLPMAGYSPKQGRAEEQGSTRGRAARGGAGGTRNRHCKAVDYIFACEAAVLSCHCTSRAAWPCSPAASVRGQGLACRPCRPGLAAHPGPRRARYRARRRLPRRRRRQPKGWAGAPRWAPQLAAAPHHQRRRCSRAGRALQRGCRRRRWPRGPRAPPPPVAAEGRQRRLCLTSLL